MEKETDKKKKIEELELNIKINDYPIIIGQELDTDLLEKCDYLEPSNLELQIIKSPEGQIVWWAKNPTLKYLNAIENTIYPNLGKIDNNPDVMYGTSVYLWFKEKKLIRTTFQIIQNKRMANHLLDKINEEIIKAIGKPSLKNENIVTWKTKTEKFMIEYPKRMHGFIHIMESNND
jgi:hypothetical protein